MCRCSWVQNMMKMMTIMIMMLIMMIMTIMMMIIIMIILIIIIEGCFLWLGNQRQEEVGKKNIFVA